MESIKHILSAPLFSYGSTQITLGSLFYVVVLAVLLFLVSAVLQKWLVRLFRVRRSVEAGVAQAIASIIRYVLLVIGFLVILQTSGVDLSSFTVLAGALGIGLGFGLQNIANNLVSGLIILFERPIKLGDRIEVGTVTGDVVRISLRSTVVRTNDNIDIIVPNSDFITSRVTNWSYADRDVRFNFPVSVSYNANPEHVMSALLEAARTHPGVLIKPPPEAVFLEFGESSLNFVLRVWSREYITRPLALRSELNVVILKNFRERGIEIPYPQRDIHIRSGTISVKTPE